MIAWLVVSGLFTLYVQLFGSYETTYGALGTTIASMVWLWQSNLMLLSGLTVDAELYQWEGAGDPPGVRGALRRALSLPIRDGCP